MAITGFIIEEDEEPDVSSTNYPTPNPSWSAVVPALTPRPVPTRTKPTSRAVITAVTSAPGDALDRIPNLSRTKRPTGPQTGLILNDMGEFCRFQQAATETESVSYFYEELTGTDTLLLFDEIDCMKTTLGDLGMGIMQNLINERIANWYGSGNTEFATHPSELYPESPLQVRGWCMPSTTSEYVAVLIEYFVEDEAIVAVLHGTGITCEE